MPPERLASMDVGEMHFDEGDGDGGEGVAQRYAGMGEAARVDEDGRDALLAGTLHPVDQLPLVVALEAFDLGPGGPPLLLQSAIDRC